MRTRYTNREKNSLSSSQDVFDGHNGPVPDRLGGAVQHFLDGARYLLACIDVFSKKAWAVPVRTKTGCEVANAFEKILADDTPNIVQSESF